MEEWRDIEGYEGLYQVSNYGRVKSLERNVTTGFGDRHIKEKIIILNQLPNGYLYYCLSKNNKKKGFYIHRLVAETFIPNPNNLPEVNHKDEDKTNNCIENLEWCDRSYNINYGTCKKRISNALKGQILKEETKKKISTALKGRKRPIEITKKIAEALRNSYKTSKRVCQLTLDNELVKKWMMLQKLWASIKVRFPTVVKEDANHTKNLNGCLKMIMKKC